VADGDRLLELLGQWEEGRRQGHAPAAEDLCPDDPALQDVLRRHIRQREHFGELGASQDDTPPALASLRSQREHLAGLGAQRGTEPALRATAPAAVPQVEGFEVLGTLGRGGMGVVYKARQSGLDRLVALKVIVAGRHVGPSELSRFHREAEAVARLQHPNIVQVYEIGEQEGVPYLALEFVDGGSLADRLDGTPLAPERAAEWVLCLARAVEHAHRRGVLHRDLKPANVLVTSDGTLKLTDFGLAKRLDVDGGETTTGMILGTPSYMAPEQAAGRVHEVGPAADVYALGAILYELLTGRPPFKGATTLETLEQVRTHEPVPPTALQPRVPRDLETICLKCLQKEPRHRYASAEALADDLQCFLAGEPISARSLTPLEQLTRTVSYASPMPVSFRAWSRYLLWASPFPAVTQLVLFLLFRTWPSYPVICVLTGVLGGAVVDILILWPFHRLLRRAPRGYRRYAWSLMLMRCAGWALVPALVGLIQPTHDLADFYLVFPFYAFMDGNYYLMTGSENGLGYPLAVLHYAAALLICLALPFGPLIVGVLLSGNMFLDGLFLRLSE
jgi:serine/threonine protein kinase